MHLPQLLRPGSEQVVHLLQLLGRREGRRDHDDILGRCAGLVRGQQQVRPLPLGVNQDDLNRHQSTGHQLSQAIAHGQG